jgi:hypothetical protein
VLEWKKEGRRRKEGGKKEGRREKERERKSEEDGRGKKGKGRKEERERERLGRKERPGALTKKKQVVSADPASPVCAKVGDFGYAGYCATNMYQSLEGYKHLVSGREEGRGRGTGEGRGRETRASDEGERRGRGTREGGG